MDRRESVLLPPVAARGAPAIPAITLGITQSDRGLAGESGPWTAPLTHRCRSLSKSLLHERRGRESNPRIAVLQDASLRFSYDLA
jgi:hypothetical protein